MPQVKVATCCYCGTRAALQLTGATRHELACGSCGAPISKLKMLPSAQKAVIPGVTEPERRKAPKYSRHAAAYVSRKPKKRKKSKSFGRRALSEIWDVIEDIID